MTSSQLQNFFEHPSFRHYQQVGEIQWGGMGAVVKVHDSTQNQFLALKIMCTTSENSIERFQREIRALKKLSNPHIVRIIDFGVFGSDFYYLMEWIEGQSLAKIVQESFHFAGQSLAPAKIQRIFSQLVQALQYCHAKGIVHRDLKPENIMIRDDNHVMIIDFGLARELQEQVEISKDSLIHNLTKTGEILGTPHYMSPEQVDFKGQFGPISFKTDIWALGATLHYVLTGQAPYHNQSTTSVLMSILDRPIEQAILPKEAHYQSLNELCLNCLKKKQSQRPSLETILMKVSGKTQGKRQKRIIFALIFFFSFAVTLAVLFAIKSPNAPLQLDELQNQIPRITNDKVLSVSGKLGRPFLPIKAGSSKTICDENGHFKISIPLLKEGINKVRFVIGQGSHANSVTIPIIRDSTPALILLPIQENSGKVLNIDSNLQGTVSDKHGIKKLTLNGKVIELIDGSFNIPWPDQMAPQELLFIAEDNAGNQSQLRCKGYSKTARMLKSLSDIQRTKLLKFIRSRGNNLQEQKALLHLTVRSLWLKSSKSIQDQAISVIGKSLGPDFQWIETRERTCHSIRARIATFEHKKTGIQFQLIPGELRETVWWRNPLFEYTVRYLEILASNDCDRRMIATSFILPPSDDYTKTLLRFLGKKYEGVSLNIMDAFSIANQIPESDLPRFRTQITRRLTQRKSGKRFKKRTEYVAPFLIAKRELSLRQWRRIANLPTPPKNIIGSITPWPEDLSTPVFGPQSLCLKWLKKADFRFRLPNRHEWAVAAQGGSDKRFFWGEDISKMDQYGYVYSGGLTNPQSTKSHRAQTNAYGLSDVYGNVSEWVDPDWASWRKTWPQVEPSNSFFQGVGESDIFRWGLSMGGSCITPPALCQIKMVFFQPVVKENPLYSQKIGLRVAVSLP